MHFRKALILLICFSLFLVSFSIFTFDVQAQGFEDFTTWTEAGAEAAKLDQTATRSSWTNLMQKDEARLYDAKTLNDFEYDFRLNVQSFVNDPLFPDAKLAVPMVFCVTETTDTPRADEVNNRYMVLEVYKWNSSTSIYKLQVISACAAASYSNKTDGVLNVGTVYYIRVSRTGTDFRAKIYSDVTFFTLVEEIYITVHNDNDITYSYMHVPSSRDQLRDTASTGYVEYLGTTNYVTIGNLEGCGNWAFTEQRYYEFSSSHYSINVSTIWCVGISFVDAADHNITVFYDYPNDTYTVHSGEDYINLQNGEYTFQNESDSSILQSYTVSYLIYLRSTIIDSMAVSIYQFENTTSSAGAWTLASGSYFNIYNIGGYSSVPSTSGNAGQIAGGDMFDFYGYSNTSEVEASIIFRNLQHVKMLPQITFTGGNNYSGFALSYYIDICRGNDTEFWQAFGTKISVVAGTYTSSARFVNFSAQFFRGSAEISQTYLQCYPRRSGGVGTTFDMLLWVDLWLNRVNSSSTFGARVNAFEYPVMNNAPAWLQLWVGSWGVDDSKEWRKMGFDQILDSANQVVYAEEIKLVRLRAKLEVFESAQGLTQYVTVHDYNVFDMTFYPVEQPFQGIQTPPWDETKFPTIEQNPFIGAIFSALAGLGTVISNSLGPAILGFWSLFVAFLDSVGAALGFPNAFSTFLNMLTNAWIWLGNSVTYVASMLLSVFSFLGATMTKFVSLLSQVITFWILTIQGIISFLDSGLGTVGGVWDMLGMTNWLILFLILYPLALLFMWEEQGLQAVLDHLTFVYNIVNTAIHLFITLIQYAINIIGRIIESIPIIE